MIHCNDIHAVRAQVKQWKSQGQSVAFVPTMGNLHNGHLELVKRGSALADKVVVSIFVNPLQFNERTDFDAYPRTLENDASKLESVNTDALFLPSSDEIYPRGQASTTKITVPGFNDVLEGEFRPGHFIGVATVVNKLFNIVQPDVACFGEKDFQQLMLVRKMVTELDMPIAIEAVATVREPNGLAMSSRNTRLSEPQKDTAKVLYQCLCSMKQKLQHGSRDYSRLENEASELIQQQGLEPEYMTIRRRYDVAPPSSDDKELVILVAASLNQVRLIDNITLNL